jgi:SAM-dependent methyltransferase
MRRSVPVLRSQEEILAAQRRAHSLRLCEVPDERKSWDNIYAVEAIRTMGHGANDPIADLGCRSGITLTWLDQLGYRQLYGCDLRGPFPPVRSAIARRKPRTAACGIRMYARNRQRMCVAPVEETPFPDGRFAAVTAMSVIEHGVDTTRFFAEAARLLRPGGLLILSTDYWPCKVATQGLRCFPKARGVDRVYTRRDIEELVAEARRSHLQPREEFDLEAGEPVIESDGLRYTFLALSFLRE